MFERRPIQGEVQHTECKTRSYNCNLNPRYGYTLKWEKKYMWMSLK